MNKPIILRDVMNSKSTYHCRHSENAFNIKNIAEYYAIESRVFNSAFNEEKGRYEKGSLWFTNLMVFDFDFDEAHFPNISNYEEKLNDSLSLLKSILGTPRYTIYNKENYTEKQKEIYFTKYDKDGSMTVSLPKKYGCQVVYELSESVKSQFEEVVALYKEVRYQISKLTDSDLDFKGHMFKNFYNKELFNIVENKNFDIIDIYETAKKYCQYSDEKLNDIKELNAFETFKSKLEMPKHFKAYSAKLYNYYVELNSWKGDVFKGQSSLKSSLQFSKSESRNETMFRYLRSLPVDVLKEVSYSEILDSKLFDSCIISEGIDEFEFESTKESVLAYKEKYGCDIEYSVDFLQSDNRVFKFDQEELKINFFKENKEKFEKAYSNSNNKMIDINWNSRSISIPLYDCSQDSNILANILLGLDAEYSLTNVRSLFTPDVVNWVNGIFGNKYGLYDVYDILKSAVYLTHFKYYREIQNIRKAKIEKTKTNNRLVKRNEKIKEYGFNFKGNVLGFKCFYSKLQREGLLKEDGSPMTISFYQNHFKIRNSEASALSKLVKRFLIAVKNISLFEELKVEKENIRNSFQVFVTGDKSIFSGISSRNDDLLIRYFNIGNIKNKLFNIKDKYNNIAYSNKYLYITIITDSYYVLSCKELLRKILETIQLKLPHNKTYQIACETN